MDIEIKRWDNEKIIIAGKYESIRDCLEKNRYANLSSADLRRADLSHADLSHANLSHANLSSADLRHTNLSHANLSSAVNFFHSANLGELSDKLTLELMRWDATICGGKLMDKWIKDGACPFGENMLFPRLFWFAEKKSLWKKGKPQMTLRQVYEAILDELKIKR